MTVRDLYALLNLPQDTPAAELRAAYERAMTESSRMNHFSRMAELSGALDRLPMPVRQSMYLHRNGVGTGLQLPRSARMRRRLARRSTSRLPSPIFLGLLALTAAGGTLAATQPSGSTSARVGVFIFILAGWLVSLCLHEFAHALVAHFGGDDSIAAAGYLRLNPFRYAHPFLSIGLPVLWIAIGGIGLPGGAVYIHRHKLRSRVWASAVSAAGPLVNAVMALLAIGFLQAADGSQWQAHIGFDLFAAVAWFAWLQVAVLILNLLPIPGLDGWGIIEPWLAPSTQNSVAKVKPYGLLILIVFLATPRFSSGFSDLVTNTAVKLGNPDGLAFIGDQLFRFWNH